MLHHAETVRRFASFLQEWSGVRFTTPDCLELLNFQVSRQVQEMCADGDNFIKDSGTDMTKNKLVNNLGGFVGSGTEAWKKGHVC